MYIHFLPINYYPVIFHGENMVGLEGQGHQVNNVISGHIDRLTGNVHG